MWFIYNIQVSALRNAVIYFNDIHSNKYVGPDTLLHWNWRKQAHDEEEAFHLTVYHTESWWRIYASVNWAIIA